MRENHHKVVYLLGAGASYGKRRSNRNWHYSEAEGDIIEGLPIIREIPQRLDFIRNRLKKKMVSVKENESELCANNIFVNCHLKSVLEQLITDFAWLINNVEKVESIDTFAKMLYDENRVEELNKLKLLESILFVIEQSENLPDSRYDDFIYHSMLDRDYILDDRMRILNWNYDVQLLISLRKFLPNKKTNNYSQLKWYTNLLDAKKDAYDGANRPVPQIVMLNGIANFEDGIDITKYNSFSDDLLLEILLRYSHGIKVGFKQPQTSLSFAWDSFETGFGSTKKILHSMVHDAEYVVVVGYSFPKCNREIDRLAFAQMPYLKKVYIQDPNSGAVKESISSLLSSMDGPSSSVELIEKDSSHFITVKEIMGFV